MRRAAAGLILALMLITFPGCAALTGNDGTEILGFLLETTVGTPVIDPGARTVGVTVEPVDLAAIPPPVFTLSDGATIDGPPLLEDEVPAAFTVTAENGDTATWTVTVTVQPGIGFTLSGARVSLTRGFTDTGDATHDEALGSGEPPAVVGEARAVYHTAIAAFQDQDYDHAVGPLAEDYRLLMLYLAGAQATGEQTSTDQTFPLVFWSDYGVILDSSVGTWVVDEVTVNVLEYGAVGGIVRGTFEWTWDDGMGNTGAMTQGYFKVTRIEDLTPLFPLCGNCETY